MMAPSGCRAYTGAVVRKPPGKESAGDGRGCHALYGDLGMLVGADDGGDSGADVTLAIVQCVGAEIRSDFGASNGRTR
jgi:hypothetical protein